LSQTFLYFHKNYISMVLNYKELGFLCGIELHQELNNKKLFCNCTTALKEQQKTFEIKRKLRATAGELGKTDAAAAFEQLRDKEFSYQGFNNEACLVEADEEPPHPANQEHLQNTLTLAKLLKLEIPDTLYVMRKIVTDGSACSGFQRTILIGLEGNDSFITTNKGKVKITQLNLEEDSSKILKREDGTTTYSLSRQGIPLWEVSTDASIKDPEHTLEVAKHLGMIFRSFPTIKRGIGSIRQDVNISIRGGTRIEVKGWQDLKTLPLLIENEVLRQKKLLDIKEELHKRGLKEIKETPLKVTEIFTKTSSKIIQSTLSNNGDVYALKLPHFTGLLKQEVCPGKTFGKELAEYAMSHGTKGMIHSDEDLSKYGLIEEFKDVCERINSKPEDLVLIVSEQEDVAKKSIQAVLERAKYCLIGIPKETRVPNHVNATSSFARPLPGAGRMYPESDLYPLPIDKKTFKKLKLPELFEDKIQRISKKYSLNKEKVKEALREGQNLEDYFNKYKNIQPKFILTIILELPKEIKTRFNLNSDILEEKHYHQVLELLSKETVPREAAIDLLLELIKTGTINLEKYKTVSDKDLENGIKKIIEQHKGAPFNALMGEAMKAYRGRADGKKIAELIKKYTK